MDNGEAVGAGIIMEFFKNLWKSFLLWLRKNYLWIIAIAILGSLLYWLSVSNLNSQALAVILGVLISSIITWLTNLQNQRMEEEQWIRHQKEEKMRREREEQLIEIERVREIYHNCLRSLAEIQSSNIKETVAAKLSDQDRIHLYQEANKWLTILALHRTDQYKKQGFRSEFEVAFTQLRSIGGDVSGLYRIVQTLALTDPLLTRDSELVAQEELSSKSVTIFVDQSYRLEQFSAEGVEIPERFNLLCEWRELTVAQREKLAEIYFGSTGMPDRLTLNIPKFDHSGKRIGIERWRAKLNLLSVTQDEVFSAWEQDYIRAESGKT